MDKRLKSTRSCLFSLIVMVAVTSSVPAESIFGQPNVTLDCLVDDVMLNKVVKVQWQVTLKNESETSLSTDEINDRIYNCEANITCSHGYIEEHGCEYASVNLVEPVNWEFSVWFNATRCSVEVIYYDYKDDPNKPLKSNRSCSYSAPNSTIVKQSSAINPTVDKPYWIQCSVSTSEQINSIVKIDWSGPDGFITNDSRIIIHPTVSDDGIIHNSTLQFLYLSQNDTGSYTCNVTILDTTISKTFLLDNITTFGPPNVTLKCSADYVTLNKVVEVSWKPTLLTSTEKVNERAQAHIKCKGYNHTHEFDETTDSYMRWNFSVPIHEMTCSVNVGYLDFVDYYQAMYKTSKSCSFSAPKSTIFKQSSTVNATVGKPYWIQCSVSTSKQINSSIMKIDWSGPDGSITNDSRMIIHPTVSDDGIIHNSTLQFLYLNQNDTGSYTCNVTILDTTISQMFQLDNIATMYIDSTPSMSTHLTTTSMSINTSTSSDSSAPSPSSTPIKNGAFTAMYIDSTPSMSTHLTTTSMSINTSTSSDSSAPSPSSTPIKNGAFTGSAEVAFIISVVVVGFLFISVLIGVPVYKFRRKLYFKSHYSSNNNIHFKVPSISDIAYSVTNRDDASTCESLDGNYKVAQWMKTMQVPYLDKPCDDDTYPSNEEILNYICGHGLRSNEATECKKLTKAEGIPTLTNNSVNNNDETKSVDNESLNDIIQQQNNCGVCDKDSNLQAVANDTEEDKDRAHSTVPSQNKPLNYVTLNTNTDSVPNKIYITHNTMCYWHSPLKDKDNADFPQHCGSIIPMAKYNNSIQEKKGFSQCNRSHAYKSIIETEIANCDQFSSESSDEVTESTLVSFVSSHNVDMSFVEGDYIDNKSPTHSVEDDVICIPAKSHNFHQNVVTHFDETFLTTTAIEGEYVDYNNAVQQN